MIKKVNSQRKKKLILNKIVKLFLLLYLFSNVLNAQTSKWRVVWEANPDSENVDYYTVYKGINESFSLMDSVGRVGHDTTEFIDSVGINLGQMYYYRITATNDTGVSSLPSDAANAAIPKILLNDSLSFKSDTDSIFLKENVVLDEDHDMYEDSLTWFMDNLERMYFQKGELTVEIFPYYNAEFVTTPNWQGSESIIFKVMDPDSFFDQKTVNFYRDFSDTVNHNPVIDPILNTFVFLDSLFIDTLRAYDQDGDPLYFDISGEPVWLTRNDSIIQGIPDTSSYIGINIIKIYVNDGRNGWDSTSFELRVVDPNNNNPPFFLVPLPDDTISIYINNYLEYQVIATDPDGDILSYSFSVNPTWLSINNTGLIQGTPSDIADIRTFTVTVVVDDGNTGIDSVSFNITVIDADAVIEAISDTTIYINQYFEYQVMASDPGGDILSYSFSANPTWLSINSNSGLIQGTPTDTLGTMRVSVVVKDTYTGIDSVSFNLIVLDDDTTTFGFVSTPDTVAILNELYSYKVTAYNQKGDSLYFLPGLDNPSFLNYNVLPDTSPSSDTLLVFATFNEKNLGEHDITIYVSDGTTIADSQKFTLSVRLFFSESIGDAEYKVYPNPWVESELIYRRIFFKNFSENSQLLIFNLIGEPVLNTKIDNQVFMWDVKNNSGLEVSSGLYFYYIKTDGKIVDKGKIVIVR